MLPNAAPRPHEERLQLKTIWRSPRDWRFADADNTIIRLLYLGKALLLFLLAGVLALLMRAAVMPTATPALLVRPRH